MLTDSCQNTSLPGGGAPEEGLAGQGASLSRLGLFARFLAGCTALLVFVGALVTTTGSGLSVPDWPLSFGTLNPRMVGGVMFEHGHRLVAGFVGLLTLIFALWASVSRARAVVRRVAWLALALVIFQGLLGGLTVLMRLPTPVSVAHGCTAQLFFCGVIALALLTSPAYLQAPASLSGSRAQGLRTAALAAFVIVFMQLLLGATMRHMGAGLVIPDFPTSLGRWIPPLASPEIAVNFAHRVTALMVVAIVALLIARIFRHHRELRPLPALAGLVGALVLVQVCLGALTVWSERGLVPTSLHVMNGALVLGAVFAIVMWSFRLSRSPGRTAAGGTEGGADRKDWMELAKVRLVTLSAFTAVCGYWLCSHKPSLLVAAAVGLGVLLIGSGAGILNHVLEMDTDAMMSRTRNRPLVAGRVDPVLAERVGAMLACLGILFLGVVVKPLSGLMAALAVGSYLFVYTPLKRRTPMCTVVGAIPGALPVLIGSTAATGNLSLEGIILFLILFLWQLPHFMAIAWLCKDDYARAGLPMVTVVDPAGRLAACQTVAYGLALLPVSLAPTLCGMAGSFYFFSALVLGLAYLGCGASWGWQRSQLGARRLLLASVLYLPLLYGIMMANR